VNRRNLLTLGFLAPVAAKAQVDTVDAAYRFTCESRPDLCNETYGEDRSKWPEVVHWPDIYLYNSETAKHDIQLGFVKFGPHHGHVVWRTEVETEPQQPEFEGYEND
jgi:hypothetical protein